MEQLLSKGKAVMFDKEKRLVSGFRAQETPGRNYPRNPLIPGKFPLKTGISKEELKTSQGGDPMRAFFIMFSGTWKKRTHIQEKEIVRTPDHSVNLQGNWKTCAVELKTFISKQS